MATKLKEYAFPERAARSSYPWEDWFDGSPWQLKHGEDFNSLPKSMQAYIAKVAKDKDVRVRTSLLEDGVVLQAQV